MHGGGNAQKINFEAPYEKGNCELAFIFIDLCAFRLSCFRDEKSFVIKCKKITNKTLELFKKRAKMTPRLQSLSKILFCYQRLNKFPVFDSIHVHCCLGKRKHYRPGTQSHLL